MFVAQMFKQKITLNCTFLITTKETSSFVLQTNVARSWACMDLYVFATPYRIIWDYYFSAREHTLEIKSWEETAEKEYVCTNSHFLVFFLAQLNYVTIVL